jgi:hypothetical protein
VTVIDRQGVIRAQTEALGGGPLGGEAYLRSYLAGLLQEAKGQSKAKAQGGVRQDKSGR